MISPGTRRPPLPRTTWRRELGQDIWDRLRPHERLYLLVIPEFQSTVDTHVAARIVAHIGRIHLRPVRNGQVRPQDQLPPGLPIMLYNGCSPWPAAMDMRDLIATAEGQLAELQPR